MAEKLGLSVEEAGQLLGLSRSVMYQLVRCEDFPAVHIGKRIIINAAKLQEWLDSHTQSGTIY